VLTKLARVGLTAAAMVLAATTFVLAETTATPAPKNVAQASASATASPNPFTYRGYVRAYDLTRQNAYSAFGGPGPGSKANQASFNSAISLHGDYNFLGSGFDVGASYLYAQPFNNCANPATHSSTAGPPCGTKSEPPGLNPDDTLPGFEMSTLYEAYARYDANGLYVQGGDQVMNTPWAPSSDSRLKPVSYQGVDASYKLNSNWTIEGADIWEWECRTCSNFDKGTLLTVVNPGGYAYPGASALPTTVYDPSETPLDNNGFFYGHLGYKGPKSLPLAANLYYYSFSNIATNFWADAKMTLGTSMLKPYLALQGGTENGTSSDLLGKIDSSIIGAQIGFYPMPALLLAGSFDYIPLKTDTVDLATYGLTCSAQHQIGFAAGHKAYNVAFPYFLPSGGTAQCSPNASNAALTDVYYGGWASPYTDSYATDPTFVSSGTQDMPDRRSPGSAAKIAATFTSDNRQLVTTVQQEWYDYSNPGYATGNSETDFDTQYFFAKVPKHGLYKGFSLRVRLFSRSESTWPGGSPDGLFKYSRFQAEYDF